MRKNLRLIAVVCALIITLPLVSCGTSEVKSKEVVNLNSISFTDFSKDISADRIYETIKQFSATDNARITGFEGEKNTADYIIKQFKDMGLDVTEQSFPIKAFRCIGTEVNIISPESKKINSQYLGFSISTPKEGITAEIVSGGKGANSELENAKVKGKLVLIKRGGGPFGSTTELAYVKGALGVIFYDAGQEQPMFATLLNPSKIPAVSISKSDGENIQSVLASGKSVKVTLKVDSETMDGTSKNIIATKKSKKQSNGKNIIVGAHYDGVDTPAANDNASGIATVLEVARVLSKHELDCDINFIAFGAEENGLLGSNYYVTSLSDEKKNSIIAMINLDMVGVGDTLGVHTASESAKSLPADLAVSCMNKFKYKSVRTAMELSDHVPFETAGIPVAFFDYEKDDNLHTDKDTIDKIQKENLLRVSNVVINICMEIGKNPEGFSSR